MEQALDGCLAYTLTHPILFNYRHAIELYLKVATESNERTHDVAYLVELLKQQRKTPLSRWAQLFFDQLQALDKGSTAFRYAKRWPEDEIWIDLRQLRAVANVLCTGLEDIVADRYR